MTAGALPAMVDVEAAKAFTKRWAYEPNNKLYAARSPTINFHSQHRGKPQCQAETASPMGMTTHFSQCPCRGTVSTADGATWCGKHSPEAVAKRSAKMNAKREEDSAKLNARIAADRERHRKIAAFDRLLSALVEIEAGHNDPRSLARAALGDFMPKADEEAA